MPDSMDNSSKVCKVFQSCYLQRHDLFVYHIKFYHLQVQVARLLYTNSGVGILALGANGIQRLWKWSRNEQNPSGKVMLHSLFIFSLSSLPFLSFFLFLDVVLYVCMRSFRENSETSKV